MSSVKVEMHRSCKFMLFATHTLLYIASLNRYFTSRSSVPVKVMVPQVTFHWANMSHTINRSWGRVIRVIFFLPHSRRVSQFHTQQRHFCHVAVKANYMRCFAAEKATMVIHGYPEWDGLWQWVMSLVFWTVVYTVAALTMLLKRHTSDLLDVAYIWV